MEPISLPQRNKVYVDNTIACIISPLEMEQVTKQFEHALIMNFSSGRPSLYDIKFHIQNQWKLDMEPIVTLIDARHVLNVTASNSDMIKEESHDSNRINASLFRLFRWKRNFDYTKDSTLVLVWVTLPKLPIDYVHKAVLEKIGNIIECVWSSMWQRNCNNKYGWGNQKTHKKLSPSSSSFNGSLRIKEEWHLKLSKQSFHPLLTIVAPNLGLAPLEE
ncbi:hypothetical protein CASFOL_018553 [Castilleja foliolosa]|uniref:DUF4283 domain-containing protein n=1 Tax=Castilleja foliolosa TaxID=1961234 RepID=A0ABD3D528_9LAMI